MRLPSLADVAALAGVSTGTASRALSRPHMVQESTRERILQAATKLGYVENGPARALSSRVTKTVGAIVPRFGTSSFAGMVQALEETLGRAGFTVLIASPDHRQANEAELLRKILGRGVDAVALLGAVHSPHTHLLLTSHRVPYVLMWARSVAKAAWVGFDERLAGELLVEHLHLLGHHRIGFIGGRTSDNDRARLRYQGVVEAIAQRGMVLCKPATIETDYGFREGHDAMHSVLSARQRITAVICGNDYLATGALAACAQSAINIPQTLSLASFNDNEFAAYLTPPLTTVRLPIKQIGEIAATYLLERLDGGNPKRGHELPVELIIRKSTGKARNQF